MGWCKSSHQPHFLKESLAKSEKNIKKRHQIHCVTSDAVIIQKKETHYTHALLGARSKIQMEN